jgi:hypothetical protein
MLEFLRDKELIEANPYATAKIKKLHFLPFMNIKPADYGGRVKYVAELMDSDLYLIIDASHKTIDVAKLKVEEVETSPQAANESMKCKKCNEVFDGKGKFLAHTRVCR